MGRQKDARPLPGLPPRPLPPVTAADVARTPGYRSGANTGGHATPTLSHTPRGAQTPTHPYQHRRDGGESGGGAMADYYLSPASFAAAADAAAASFASSFASSSPPSYAPVTTPMQQQGGGSGAAAAARALSPRSQQASPRSVTAPSPREGGEGGVECAPLPLSVTAAEAWLQLLLGRGATAAPTTAPAVSGASPVSPPSSPRPGRLSPLRTLQQVLEEAELCPRGMLEV